MNRLLAAIIGLVVLGALSAAFAVFVWPTYHLRPKEPYYSGIVVLDLEGDGLALRALGDSGAFFGHEDSHFRQSTGWVAAGKDGILVLKQPADGAVDGIDDLVGARPKEIFAGASAFDVLARFDKTGDGLVDAADPAFADLRIWVDENGDGLGQPGDLRTLEDVGVKALRVGHDGAASEIARNEILAVGSFVDSEGREKEMSEVGFAYDRAFTVTSRRVEIPFDILLLPTWRGYGKTRDLHEEMLRDRRLTKAVKDLSTWLSDGGHETAPPNVMGRIQQIVLLWAKAADIEPDARGSNIDARHLFTLEQIKGVTFFEEWGSGGANPSAGSAEQLESKWDWVTLAAGSRLLTQGLLHPCFETLDMDLGKDRFFGALDFDAAISCAGRYSPKSKSDIGDNREAVIAYWKPVVATLDHIAVDLAVDRGSYQAQLAAVMRQNGIAEGPEFLRNYAVRQGTDRDDLMFSGATPTLIYGERGSDMLNGGPDEDVISGGAGDDTLSGRAGGDVYVFGLGFGRDVIKDPSIFSFADDTIVFEPQILPDDVELRRDKDSDGNLLIKIRGGRDQITVVGQFARQGIELVQFADGTAWDRDRIETLARF